VFDIDGLAGPKPPGLIIRPRMKIGVVQRCHSPMLPQASDARYSFRKARIGSIEAARRAGT
jgi:hypothetical protein